jgi:mRNA-degrading endonuclease toxin of MazEF toxin-antitoxin module
VGGFAPSGSGPGFRRPVNVVQANPLNQCLIATVVYVPLTICSVRFFSFIHCLTSQFGDGFADGIDHIG